LQAVFDDCSKGFKVSATSIVSILITGVSLKRHTGPLTNLLLLTAEIAVAGLLSMRNMEPRRISQAPPLGGHTQTADFAWDDSKDLKRDDTSSEQQQSFMS
jgi:hypothetical protein